MRKDIEEVRNPFLAQALKRHRWAEGKPALEAVIETQDTAARVSTRQKLVEPKERDPNGMERVLGLSDFCSINFLARGIQASAAVARLRIRLPDGTGEWFGTGFLVAPQLLLTNQHVLPSTNAAALAIAEFNYEHDINGVEAARRVFNLMPSGLFFADPLLDATFVEIAPRAFDGTPLSQFGFLPLIRPSGKGLDGEWVTLIQHPGGQHKQIAVRDSKILTLSPEDIENVDLDRFIHYSTDTEPGSSGAPVVNDQWQVVALHHKAVPDYDSEGQRLARDGRTAWTEGMAEEEEGWVANQGVRISAIYDMLFEQQAGDDRARAVLDRLLYGQVAARQTILTELQPPALDEVFERQGADSEPDFFTNVDGYNPDFLSRSIPLPAIRSEADRARIARIQGTSETELKYTHFSVVFDAERRFARFTAVNIDGTQLKRNGDVEAPWRRDGRIDIERQPDDQFYKQSVAREAVYFQRGHLVRRVDPSWGSDEVSKRAVEDTFHFTNAAPHQATFNNSLWGDLEDYLLAKCDRERKRMTVFSGPVFRPSDPETYGKKRPNGPYKVPVEFWKVAVIQKTPTTIAAAGFKVTQRAQIDSLFGAEVVFSSGLHPYTPQELIDSGIQLKIELIEEETGLNFGALKRFDSIAGLESTFHVRPLRSAADIII
jgi:endonuclease G